MKNRLVVIICKTLKMLVFLVLAGSSPRVAGAAGTKSVWLHQTDGEAIRVATISIADDGGYRIAWDASKFGDCFLSMRPFKCLEGPETQWCRVGYPYEIMRNISVAT